MVCDKYTSTRCGLSVQNFWKNQKSTYCVWILTIKSANHYILCYLYVEFWILFMPESTEGISEGQTTAMSGENH